MKILSTLALLLITVCCSAQIKMEVGANCEMAANQSYGQNLVADIGATKQALITFNPAVLARLNINNKLTVTTGVQYLTKGVRETYNLFFIHTSITLRYNYYAVPLYVTYNFLSKHKRLNAGVMVMADFSYIKSATLHVPSTLGSPALDTTIQISGTNAQGVNRLGFTLGGGIFAGYNFNRHINIMVYPYYKRDLTNLATNVGSNYFSAIGAGVAVFYRFDKQKKTENVEQPVQH